MRATPLDLPCDDFYVDIETRIPTTIPIERSADSEQALFCGPPGEQGGKGLGRVLHVGEATAGPGAIGWACLLPATGGGLGARGGLISGAAAPWVAWARPLRPPG